MGSHRRNARRGGQKRSRGKAALAAGGVAGTVAAHDDLELADPVERGTIAPKVSIGFCLGVGRLLGSSCEARLRRRLSDLASPRRSLFACGFANSSWLTDRVVSRA
jgi:hypothetical protein